jgi:hypothetical protein
MLFLLWKIFFDFDFHTIEGKLTPGEGIVNNLLRIRKKDQELKRKGAKTLGRKEKYSFPSLRLCTIAPLR